MRGEKLTKYEGQVIVLDLVMGREITTRVQKVDLENRVVVCHKPRIFLPVPNPQNPNDIQVMPLEYGHPLYKADDEIEVDFEHIFTVFIPNEEHASSYQRITSGLVTAGAGALDGLPSIEGLQGLK